MENTPLCYIVPNCNIDGRQHGARTDTTRTDGKTRVYNNMVVFGATCNTEHPHYTHGKQFFKQNEKIVLTNAFFCAIIITVHQRRTR